MNCRNEATAPGSRANLGEALNHLSEVSPGFRAESANAAAKSAFAPDTPNRLTPLPLEARAETAKVAVKSASTPGTSKHLPSLPLEDNSATAGGGFLAQNPADMNWLSIDDLPPELKNSLLPGGPGGDLPTELPHDFVEKMKKAAAEGKVRPLSQPPEFQQKMNELARNLGFASDNVPDVPIFHKQGGDLPTPPPGFSWKHLGHSIGDVNKRWDALNNGGATGTFSGTFRGTMGGGRDNANGNWQRTGDGDASGMPGGSLGLLVSLAVSCAVGFALANPGWFWQRHRKHSFAAVTKKQRRKQRARERERGLRECKDGSD